MLFLKKKILLFLRATCSGQKRSGAGIVMRGGGRAFDAAPHASSAGAHVAAPAQRHDAKEEEEEEDEEAAAVDSEEQRAMDELKAMLDMGDGSAASASHVAPSRKRKGGGDGSGGGTDGGSGAKRARSASVVSGEGKEMDADLAAMAANLEGELFANLK